MPNSCLEVLGTIITIATRLVVVKQGKVDPLAFSTLMHVKCCVLLLRRFPGSAVTKSGQGELIHFDPINIRLI